MCHFEMPPPFKTNAPKMSNNKEVTFRRLQSLRYRFKRDSKCHAKYVTFMEEMLLNGYTEKLQDDTF